MIRNLLGSLLALIGAAAVVWSPFRPWYDGRLGRDFRLDQLFEPGGITGSAAGLLTGLFLVMLAAAVVTVLGVLIRSRYLLTVAGVLALGFTILWMVRQGQAAGDLSVDGAGNGLGLGTALAFGGSLLLLLAAAVMSGHRTAARRRSQRLDTERGEQRVYEPYGEVPHPGEPYTPQPPPGEPYPPAPATPPSGPYGGPR
ncbi:hypothetical protein, partial [Streptomyces cacaoi]